MPAGGSSKFRRSSETSPNGPATATVGSSSAATSGVTRSPRGSTLVSTTTTTGPAARRIPAFNAVAWPNRALVQTTSSPTPGDPVPAASSSASAPAWASDGPFATTTSCVPAGDAPTSAPTARARSSGQSVASSTSDATPTGASSSRDGTDALAP